jgi:hypothetical protein
MAATCGIFKTGINSALHVTVLLLQVFESLRSQADYEGLLRGLRAAGGGSSSLPGLWVKGIAAQLRGRGQRVGRCAAKAAACSGNSSTD